MELIHTSPEAITKRFLNVVKITNYNITTLPDFRRGFLGFFGFDEGLDCSESSYILNTKKDKQTLHTQIYYNCNSTLITEKILLFFPANPGQK